MAKTFGAVRSMIHLWGLAVNFACGVAAFLTARIFTRRFLSCCCVISTRPFGVGRASRRRACAQRLAGGTVKTIRRADRGGWHLVCPSAHCGPANHLNGGAAISQPSSSRLDPSKGLLSHVVISYARSGFQASQNPSPNFVSARSPWP